MKVAFTQVLFTQVVQVLHLNYCHVCPTFNLIPFFSVLKVVQKNIARNLLKCITYLSSVHYKALHAKFWKDMGKKWIFVLPRIGNLWFSQELFPPPFLVSAYLCTSEVQNTERKSQPKEPHCSHHIFKNSNLLLNHIFLSCYHGHFQLE